MRDDPSVGMVIPPASTPTVARDGETYVLTWDDGAARIEVARIRDTHGDTTGEIKVSAGLPPRKGCIEWGRINLSAIPTRTNMARTLAERAPGFDWQGALLQTATIVVAAIRRGAPGVDLKDVPPREGSRWVIWPYVELGGPTVLYAKGESCKSVLALGMALSLATGQPVVGTPKVPPLRSLYLDWETDAETHAERLRAMVDANLFATDVPSIHYHRMTAPLVEAAVDLKAEIQEKRIGFVVADSLTYALGSDVNDASAVASFYMAARLLSVPFLGITHVRKDAGNDGSETTPFGSIYWNNGARIVWEAEALKEEGSSIVRVRLQHRKGNNVRRQMQHGYNLDFRNVGPEDDELVGLTVKSLDLTTVPEFAARLTWKRRLEGSLSHGAKPLAEIADELGEPNTDKLSTALSRAFKAGYVTHLPDGRWGLASRQG